MTQGFTREEGISYPIAVGNGGTNITTYTTGDILYASSSTVLSKLPIGSSTQILTVSGGLPSWSSVAGGGFVETQIVLTSAQVKALRATPIQVVAAPGAGKFINVVTLSYKLNYGGSNVFVAGAAQTINCAYTNVSGTALSATGFLNASIVASSNQIAYLIMANQPGAAATSYENQPIVVYNTSATEISGNAANDNTITVSLTYQILTL